MSDWFRYYMDGEDGGGAGDATPPAEPEGPPPSVFQDPSRWDTPPAPPEPPNAPAAAEPPAPPEPPAAPEATPQEIADWQKQFPGGVDELWKGYNELRKRFSQGEHLQPPAAPAAPAAEQEPAPPSWLSHQFEALGPIPMDGLSAVQRTQLGELMELDPKAAANWATANANLLTQEEFAAVQNYWMQRDPWGARMAWQAAEQQAEQERQIAEYGPRMAVVDAQQQLQGMELAMEALPVMREERVDFGKWIEANPEIDEQLSGMTDPTEVKNALTVLFYNWYAPHMMEKQATTQREAAAAATAAAEAEAAAIAAAEKANQRARTATRSAPAAPQGGDASDDDIRGAIMAASRGTIPARR